MWLTRFSLALGLIAAMVTSSFAQHAGDVEFEYDLVQGKIIIEGGSPSFRFADQYFEAALGTSGLLNGFVGDPGFEAHKPIGSGDLIGFNLHAGHNGNFLHFFDANTNTLLSSHNRILNIDVAGPGSLNLTQTSGGSGLIGAAPANGEFHSHLDFQLSDLGSANFGAYGFLMSLTTNASGVGESDPFWIFLNYGMAEPAFDTAIGSITAVPEPSTIVLVSMAACGFAWKRRRMRSSKV